MGEKLALKAFCQAASWHLSDRKPIESLSCQKACILKHHTSGGESTAGRVSCIQGLHLGDLGLYPAVGSFFPSFSVIYLFIFWSRFG